MKEEFKVPRSFITDFAVCANHFKWEINTIEEIKVVIRENPTMIKYWSTMSKAIRSGYRHTYENSYIRLDEWLWNRGEILCADGTTKPDENFNAIKMEKTT